MEEEHVDRSSVGGFDDSRDTRSKYSGDSLFLQNSDHSGMTLVSSVLIDSNYLAWSWSVKILLGAKGKLGFINGKGVCPSKDSPRLRIMDLCRLCADFMDSKFYC